MRMIAYGTPVNEEEVYARIWRCGGECVCQICGKEYRLHCIDGEVLRLTLANNEVHIFRIEVAEADYLKEKARVAKTVSEAELEAKRGN